MFMGQYDYAVDAKGRLNFPAKFRDGMGETFIVTRWTIALPRSRRRSLKKWPSALPKKVW